MANNEYDILNDLLTKTVGALFKKKTKGEDRMRNFLLMYSAEKKLIKKTDKFE